MGRQIGLHLRGDDCQLLIDFIRGRDPVVISQWSSSKAEIEDFVRPCSKGERYFFWNQAIATKIRRQPIHTKDSAEVRYTVDSSLPVIEFFYPNVNQEPWNGHRAQTQGRLWHSTDNENSELDRWAEAIFRWIRKNFARNPVPLLSGYVGPDALEWYLQGGVLLPMIRPSLTREWLSWAEAQAQHRKTFGTIQKRRPPNPSV